MNTSLSWELVAAIVGSITGLAGVMFTGITVYFGHRERQERRRAEFRQVLYSKYIEAYTEIIDPIEKLTRSLYRLSRQAKAGQEATTEQLEELYEKLDACGRARSKWKVLIHPEVERHFGVFWDASGIVMAALVDEEKWHLLPDFTETLLRAEDVLVASVRNVLGVAPLGEETKHLIYTQPLILRQDTKRVKRD